MIEKIVFKLSFDTIHASISFVIVEKTVLKLEEARKHASPWYCFQAKHSGCQRERWCLRPALHYRSMGSWDWKKERKNWECWDFVCLNKINLIPDLLKLLWFSLLFAQLQTAELPATHISLPKPLHHTYNTSKKCLKYNFVTLSLGD